MASPQFKPSHKVVKQYYDELEGYRSHDVEHETAVRSAFQNLLANTAKKHHWHLVPEQSTKVKGKSIRPDGTLRDEYNLHRGYWEAKDSKDKLDVEIRKKIKKGYPLVNTIFEDTQSAVLFQNGREYEPRFDLSKPQDLCDLLNQFFSYSEPDILGFEQAIDEFKERVPELAIALKEKIEQAHKDNREFQEAFADFMDVCRHSLNPNLSEAAVDEMLIQHLLTERLFRRIFSQPDFVRRNVIAAEVEKVIDALTHKNFSRRDFLKSLDKFYLSIEGAAANLEDFSEKQHFLNTVYERFFQGYSVKVADTHGIVYTPQEIVDFMCASVAEVLEKEFGTRLGGPEVNILDPCTGTGNFVVNLINRIPKRDLKRMYEKQLFANEVMLLPYYIAALNIEHAYYERMGEYEPFEGLCFVDTLDLAEAKQQEFGFMTEENTARVEKQKNAPITVIVGNPPYNANQVNENDNNKNRTYAIVEERIRRTYARDSRATLKNKLYDPYVKFIRWATDRLGDRDGIVCLVTNNSFVHQNAFDGMRRNLLRDFTTIYHLDLHGNVRDNPKLSGTTHNVFGIKVGVGITVAVRLHKRTRSSPELLYYRVAEDWRREDKLNWLIDQKNILTIELLELEPDAHSTWLTPQFADQFSAYIPVATRSAKAERHWDTETVFKLYSSGVKTNRDDVVYDFLKCSLEQRVEKFIENYNAEVDRFKRAGNVTSIDEFVKRDEIKWDGSLKDHLTRYRSAKFNKNYIRSCLYRPFTRRYLYFDPLLINRVYQQRHLLPYAIQEDENRVIWLKVGSDWPMFALATSQFVDVLPQGGSQCFPFYVYDEDGTNRRENITDWALKEFRDEYGNNRIAKWDIFYYVYGLLHHPGYRERFADNLKRELPRIPFAPDFKAFSKAGKQLAELHLNYEELEEWELDWYETEGVPLSYHVEKMKLSKDKTELMVNDSLTLGGIPPQVFDYRLGNRSALDWVIDQYRIKTDKRSGIESDPNNPDDPEYIVRLVGQVVRVSVETVKIVNSLPEDYGAEEMKAKKKAKKTSKKK